MVCGAEIIHIVKFTLSRKWPPDFRRPFSHIAEEKEKSEEKLGRGGRKEYQRNGYFSAVIMCRKKAGRLWNTGRWPQLLNENGYRER